MNLTLYEGNTLEVLKQLPEESVDCIVTSPPYYGLRSYEGADTDWGDWKGQLGLEPDFRHYVNHMLLITEELKRVLKKEGTLFWNMGDTYSNSGGAGGDYNIGGLREGEPKYKQGKSDLPAKSLMMIPERIAMGMIDQGWILRNKIIWHKTNGMPSSVKDRFTNKWEYIFFFSKSRKYYFNLDAVRKPFQPDSEYNRGRSFNIRVRDAKKGRIKQKWGNLYTASEEEVENYDEKNYQTKHDKAVNRSGSYSDPLHTKAYHPNGANPGDVLSYSTKFSDDYDAKNAAGYSEKMRTKARQEAKELYPDDEQKQQEYINFIHDHAANSKGANPGDVSEIPAERHKSWASNAGHEHGHERVYDPDANGSDFMSVPTHPHPFAHFAVYPEKLIEPLIIAGCPEYGTVLDPFSGSGTTMLVAKRLLRSAIGIEIVPEYIEIAKKRLEWNFAVDIEFEYKKNGEIRI